MELPEAIGQFQKRGGGEMQLINRILAGILFLSCCYQYFFLLVPFLKKGRPHGPGKDCRFAVLIAARNEETVIGELIDSIRRQDYPPELIDIYVAADNCRDDTARVAAEHGAIVARRFDAARRGKGYALRFLLDRMEALGKTNYDAYLVFDADNVLDPGFVREMARSLSDGYEIVTGLRNSKNYGDNWLSAAYGIWFLRQSQFMNRPRMLLGTGCSVSGAGFCFSRRVLEEGGGWQYFTLTEDLEFSVAFALRGIKAGYNERAVFYDEQPTDLRQAWTQRLRWTKGSLQVFFRYWRPLLKAVLREGSFTCYDLVMCSAPLVIVSLLMGLINMAAFLWNAASGLFVPPDPILLLRSVLLGYLGLYLIGLITVLTQWKKIHCSPCRKLLSTLGFPVFMLMAVPIGLAALVQKVEWQPISHTRCRNLHEIMAEK